MTNKLEAAVIKNNLAIRYSTIYNCWQVYTTIHGTGVFRWLSVTESVKNWYLQTFPGIRIVASEEVVQEQTV